MSSIADRISKVKNNIAAACERAGRDEAEVKLVVVTKSADIEQMIEVVRAGHYSLGENRVQRLKSVASQMDEFLKRNASNPDLPARVNWHMIGHLQRNKVRQVLDIADIIHSVDTLRLAEEINSRGQKTGSSPKILLQVNATNEPQKYGVPVGAVTHLAEQMQTMSNLQLVGLMTMAPLTRDEGLIRSSFIRLRELFAELKGERLVGPEFTELSMGMSNDYEIAVEEGATLLRVGSAIFKG